MSRSTVNASSETKDGGLGKRNGDRSGGGDQKDGLFSTMIPSLSSNTSHRRGHDPVKLCPLVHLFGVCEVIAALRGGPVMVHAAAAIGQVVVGDADAAVRVPQTGDDPHRRRILMAKGKLKTERTVYKHTSPKVVCVPGLLDRVLVADD